MAKGYWVVHVSVDDPDAYEAYRTAIAAPLEAYGGHFIIRAGTQVVPEGAARPRCVVIEFATYQRALDCYHSPEYQAARRHRLEVSDIDFVIVEGYDG